MKHAAYHRAVLASAAILLSAFPALAPVHAQGDFKRNLPQRGQPARLALPDLPGDIYIPKGLSKRMDSAMAAEGARARRGAAEVALFRNAGPSVVLLYNPESLGSGSVISADGRILTSWHVVGDEGEMAVFFQPPPNGTIKDAKFIIAEVVRVDQVADLALLQLREPLPATAKPIPLAPLGSIKVGDDVHAIGHPVGEAWTYTKGYVSAIRPRYEWVTESGVKHRAEVVQTQTPINPGNSGGPLLNNAGQLVGVNAFGKNERQALNYAVSVTDVRVFMQRGANRIAEKACQGEVLFEGRNKENNADLKVFDEDCDGKEEYVLLRPDDKNEPIYVLVDADHNGAPDGEIRDEDRDGKWDISFWDEDGDGSPDVVGHHPNGEPEPSSFSKYTG